jgi:YidC/Oxa1 family membrane protein insertase
LEDRRNIIVAVLLTGMILFGWPYVAAKFFPQPVPVTKTITDAPVTESGAVTPDAGIGSATVPAKTIALNAALKGTARVLIETPKLKGSINLEGGKIDDLLLLAHRTDLPKNSPPVRLFSPSGTKDTYFARFGWAGTAIDVPDDKTVWNPSATTLTPSTPVTLSWTNNAKQTFEIVLSIDKDYMITAEQRFTNGSDTPALVSANGLISRLGKPVDATTSGSFFTRIHIGPMGVFENAANYDWNYKDVAAAPNGQTAFKTTGGWIGFTDKYWLAALIPDQKSPTNAKFISKDNYNWAQMAQSKQTSVPAGATIKQTSRLFAGAKEVEVLDNYVDTLGIQKLDFAIDWGWFRVIEKAFFKVLHFLFGLFGNFGFAIIGLTVIVRMFMFPIAQRQFASMAQMRAVQPKMKAVQERWKDDKPRQQQEIMKLYKEEKVNPLAGCLPIILQIPIFFALYKLLMLTIEMRHQPFILWIKDLSVPDPSTALLFHSVGITLPAFLAIGVLPILLGISMWMMQRLNPQPMDDVQKQVFAVMPWMMMFMFAPLAAGLQIYYVFSNVISILQQKWLYSRHPILKQQMAKDAADKAAAKIAT